MKTDKKPLYIGIALILLCVVMLVIASVWQSNDCAEKGGELVESGTTTTYIMSGKVLVPSTSTTYKCDVE